MELEPAPVRLLDRKRVRILLWLERASLPPGQILRPRLELVIVQRVGARANVEHDRVHLQRHRPIEDREQLLLLFPRAERGLRRPVDVVDGRDPDAAKLALNLWRLLRAE